MLKDQRTSKAAEAELEFGRSSLAACVLLCVACNYMQTWCQILIYRGVPINMLLDDSQVANVEIYTTGVPNIPCFIIIYFFFLSWPFFPSFQVIVQARFWQQNWDCPACPQATHWWAWSCCHCAPASARTWESLGARTKGLQGEPPTVSPLRIKHAFLLQGEKPLKLRYNLDSILAIPAASTLIFLQAVKQ